MKNEAVSRIMKMITPKVTIVAAADDPNDPSGGIIGQGSHEYYYPDRIGAEPIHWEKRFNFRADKQGNVFSTEGLF